MDVDYFCLIIFNYYHRLKSQFTTTVRANYSNPPAHGARIAAAIFNNKALNDEWFNKHKIIIYQK